MINDIQHRIYDRCCAIYDELHTVYLYKQYKPSFRHLTQDVKSQGASPIQDACKPFQTSPNNKAITLQKHFKTLKEIAYERLQKETPTKTNLGKKNLKNFETS